MLKRFFASEDGAVTVDWVVLTAAVVGLAVGIVSVLANSTEDVGDGVESYMTNADAGNF